MVAKMETTVVPQKYDDVQFDWVQLSADLDPAKNERFMAKTQRKFAENPFVPIGEY